MAQLSEAGGIGIVALKIRNLSLDGKKCPKGLEHVTLLDFENLSFPNFVFSFFSEGPRNGKYWVLMDHFPWRFSCYGGNSV